MNVTEKLVQNNRSESSTIELLQLLENKKRIEDNRTTVVGIVCPKKGLTHSITNKDNSWTTTKARPDIYLPAKLERVIKSNKRFIIVIGGRGSGKSVGIADICLVDAKRNGSKTYCLREYQSSIKNSVYNLLKEEYRRLEFNGFDSQSSSIRYQGEDVFQFAGISRNVDSIKSAHGFKRFCVEEAQFASDESLTALTPTARAKPKKGLPGDVSITEGIHPGVSIVFVANPSSSEDPFSKRFINPFKESLDRDGYYEDSLHLIVIMNYTENPWFMDSELEEERKWDYEFRSRAAYDHIWLGYFNDSVEDSLIMSEWFDACIDAHKRLGFEAKGVKMASHDPSDLGGDSKGYAARHGSLVTDIQENLSGNVNEGGHWAAKIAISQGVDSFTWDGDGMGIGLNEQMSKDFDGKHTSVSIFRGSEEPDFPDAMYSSALGASISDQKTNKDSFRNKRAQYYFMLRDRCYRTYRSIMYGEYNDPETLISFDSNIELLSKLRAELCRIPIKPNSNGLFELYTKPIMKSKFKISSPNLADSVMMLMRYKRRVNLVAQMPKQNKRIGRR
jgi:phage terminase large subunit